MHEFLQTILAHKREEVRSRKRAGAPDATSRGELGGRRDFAAALREPGVSAIAEIKRRSPSRGPLRADLDPAGLAQGFERHGARALSVLTDAEFFGGSAADLIRARRATSLPVLRKDFVIDPFQIHESALLGADAVLLIVRILGQGQLTELLALAAELGLAALVEVHSEAELQRAHDAGAELIGVNSRDLDTFRVDLEVALRLRASIREGRLAVAESGIHTRQDVQRLVERTFDGMLVGESLMRSPDPGAKLGELLGSMERQR